MLGTVNRSLLYYYLYYIFMIWVLREFHYNLYVLLLFKVVI